MLRFGSAMKICRQWQCEMAKQWPTVSVCVRARVRVQWMDVSAACKPNIEMVPFPFSHLIESPFTTNTGIQLRAGKPANSAMFLI